VQRKKNRNFVALAAILRISILDEKFLEKFEHVSLHIIQKVQTSIYPTMIDDIFGFPKTKKLSKTKFTNIWLTLLNFSPIRKIDSWPVPLKIMPVNQATNEAATRKKRWRDKDVRSSPLLKRSPDLGRWRQRLGGQITADPLFSPDSFFGWKKIVKKMLEGIKKMFDPYRLQRRLDDDSTLLDRTVFSGKNYS
jgi:hypothetical protein